MILPDTLSSYKHRMMLPRSWILLLYLSIAVEPFRFFLSVLCCDCIELIGVVSCEGGYGSEVVQYDGIQNALSDIVGGAVGRSSLESSALEVVVFRLDGFPSGKV